jgi:hypothetical protein
MQPLYNTLERVLNKSIDQFTSDILFIYLVTGGN